MWETIIVAGLITTIVFGAFIVTYTIGWLRNAIDQVKPEPTDYNGEDL